MYSTGRGLSNFRTVLERNETAGFIVTALLEIKNRGIFVSRTRGSWRFFRVLFSLPIHERGKERVRRCRRTREKEGSLLDRRARNRLPIFGYTRMQFTFRDFLLLSFAPPAPIRFSVTSAIYIHWPCEFLSPRDNATPLFFEERRVHNPRVVDSRPVKSTRDYFID